MKHRSIMALPLGENDPIPNITYTFREEEGFQTFITTARDELVEDETEFLHSDTNGYEYYIIRLIKDDADMFAYMRRENLYITAFRVGGITYEFTGVREFTGSVQLPYKESYPSAVRGYLCYYGFETTVTTLIEQMRFPDSDKWDWRNNIFVVIIHLAEAIRYQLFSNLIQLTKYPTYQQAVSINAWIMLLIKNWQLLSAAANECEDDDFELDDTEMGLLQGFKDEKDSWPEHLKRILLMPRICYKLVAITCNYLA